MGRSETLDIDHPNADSPLHTVDATIQFFAILEAKLYYESAVVSFPFGTPGGRCPNDALSLIQVVETHKKKNFQITVLTRYIPLPPVQSSVRAVGERGMPRSFCLIISLTTTYMCVCVSNH